MLSLAALIVPLFSNNSRFLRSKVALFRLRIVALLVLVCPRIRAYALKCNCIFSYVHIQSCGGPNLQFRSAVSLVSRSVALLFRR